MADQYEYLKSELPAIKLFKELGYQYWDGRVSDERTDITEVILMDRLLAVLQRINPWLDEPSLQKAFEKITSVQGNSLMEINQQIWELIRSDTFSVKQNFDGEEEFRAVSYIDYAHIENNDFLVVNQLKVYGRANNSIPDLIIYLNGLPIAVIECKSPLAQGAFEETINDLEFYQVNSQRLFHYNQICAGIWETGGKYGAIGSPKAFYSVFKTAKNEGPVPGVKTLQDKLIYNLFRKENLLDIIRHFVIFELEEGRTIKKLPRYQQIRATNNTIAKLQTGHGGVVWHTQGSGKSITMAYVTRKLQSPEYGFNNPTVIILTDRKDLDLQISGTFRAVKLKNVHQASSVIHLQQLLKNDYGGIITTTLQKFQQTEKEVTDEADQTQQEEEAEGIRVEKQIVDGNLIKTTRELIAGKWVISNREEIRLEELSNKENLYVLVDEAHRSQYGFLASFMRTALPYAKFVAFTGTPISKDDKSTLGEFYGGAYLDVYTIGESVEDGATVPLLYDVGKDQLDVKKSELDAKFELRFSAESEEKKEKLKGEALRTYQFSRERVDSIARHILTHFTEKIYSDGHKAMLVCDGRFGAIRYKQAFEELKIEGFHNFETRVVVSLGSAKSDHLAREYYEALEHNRTNPDDLLPIWVTAPEDVKDVTLDFKLDYGNVGDTEKSGKKKYDNTAILIVSDMLLTGYDAPIAACLYLDKPLKEHNLLQAIARVNRIGKRKVAGFIMDYNGITDDLIHALKIFGEDMKPSDVLVDIATEFPRLQSTHQILVQFFRRIKFDRVYQRDDFIDAAVLHIEPLDLRDEFKEALKKFNTSLSIVLPNKMATVFSADFKLFNEIKLRARNVYPDDEELKISKEESKMLQGLIDEHLTAQGVQSLLGEPISILDPDKFAEALAGGSTATKELIIRNKLKHIIKVGEDKNPDFFKPLAQRLEELLKLRDEERITHHQLLLDLMEMRDDILNYDREGIEKGFVTAQERAIYESMKVIFGESADDATKTLFDLIRGYLGIIEWDTKSMVLKELETTLVRFLATKVDRVQAKMKVQELITILKLNKDA